EKRRAIELPGRARAHRELGEVVEHGDRLVVRGQRPVVSDDACEPNDLVRRLGLRRAHADADEVAPVVEAAYTVLEHRVGAALVHSDCRGELIGDLAGERYRVDPEEPRPAETGGCVIEVLQLLGPLALEQDERRPTLRPPGGTGLRRGPPDTW